MKNIKFFYLINNVINMGCCLASQVTDFTRVNTKNDLKKCFNNEINRILILRQNFFKMEALKPEEKIKKDILDKILHEDNWLILPIVESIHEEHVIKLKFFMLDYFQVTEKWDRKEMEENLTKIINYYKDNKIQIKTE